MKYKVHLNLTRWLVLLIPCIAVTYLFFYDESIIFTALGVALTFFIFFYARPPALLFLDDEIELSFFGMKTKIPYHAITISIEKTTRELGSETAVIVNNSGVYPIKWIYWIVLFSGIAIFIAITLKEGYEFKIARASLAFIVVGFIFVYLIQKIIAKLYSIRLDTIVLNMHINESHSNTLDKWPFCHYKNRWFIYQLGTLSFINKKDLKNIINIFKEKLNGNRLHKSVLTYEKELLNK